MVSFLLLYFKIDQSFEQPLVEFQYSSCGQVHFLYNWLAWLSEEYVHLSIQYTLLLQYVFVSTKTNALHDACEQLLADQTKLINSAESIRHDLEFFNELDRISTVNFKIFRLADIYCFLGYQYIVFPNS